MMINRRTMLAFLAAAGALPAMALDSGPQAEPLNIGDSWRVDSKLLGETRRVNIFEARAAGAAGSAPLPVLYMPDGGLAEDFLHVAGLLQVLVSNGSMRPFRLVGIENTQRRRDLTPPTSNAEDRKIAPIVGGSAAFRSFLREELMPLVRRRYACTAETAIIGESLSGLFVTETLLLEPTLFDTYIAIDPSLWWDDQRLVTTAAALVRDSDLRSKHMHVATSGTRGMAEMAKSLGAALAGAKGVQWHSDLLLDETHQSVFHPAALRAFRALFKPI